MSLSLIVSVPCSGSQRPNSLLTSPYGFCLFGQNLGITVLRLGAGTEAQHLGCRFAICTGTRERVVALVLPSLALCECQLHPTIWVRGCLKLQCSVPLTGLL